MESMIEKLYEICELNPLKEKVLVVDSYSIGEQITFHYTKKGYSLVNLKIKTVRDLALQSMTKHEEYIDRTIGTHLIHFILKSLKEDGKLQYFHELEVTPTLSYNMYKMIQEIRLSGHTSITLDEKIFVTPNKGQDLIEILKGYEQSLVDYHLRDDYYLYNEAVKKSYRTGAIYLLQNNLPLTYMQNIFLEKYLPKNHIHLPLAPVYGVTIPQQTSLSTINTGLETPLSFIYHLDKFNGNSTNLDLFASKTEEQELKEVIGRMKERQLSLDECTIYYSNKSPYVTTMFHLAESLNIPVTFSEGISIRFTKPGKLLLGFLRWLKEFYSVSSFNRILHEGLLKIGDDGPSSMRWMTILRDAKIGWGEKRYISLLKNQVEKIEERIVNETNDQKVRYFQELRLNILWLLDWYKRMFSTIPFSNTSNTFSYEKLLFAMKQVINEHSNVTSSYDQAAKESMLNKIERLIPYAAEEVTIDEGVRTLEELLLETTVGASRPKQGHLHFSSYEKGIYVNRSYSFIVGLDNSRFPGGNREDPLLLDIERKSLGNTLPLMEEEARRKQYEMLQLLASSQGEITLSYCQFDVNENRNISPAHLFLQCYRLQSGNREANFKDLKQALPTVENGPIIGNKDWWTQKLLSPNPKVIDESLMSLFGNVVAGLEGEMWRNNTTFSIFDGKIESDTSEYDPRENPNRTITAGKLEMLASCPYTYFLQEILKLKPIEDVEFDPSYWLDPATRGSLLHEIYEVFYETIQERSEKPSVKSHLKLIYEIASSCLERVKLTVPPPNKKVEIQEKEEILESCESFLKIEEETSHFSEPKYFEYTFGINGIPPAKISLPSGDFYVAGKIDRVDKLHDQSYQIIDYKTGSTWGYSENDFYKGGRQLQHLLYTLAIENHLSLMNGEVSKSSYLFPTKKGVGKTFERAQGEATRTNGLDILEKLLTIIQHGHFTLTDDKSDCKFCDFKSICKRSDYGDEMIELKHQDVNATGVRSFKGVRAYD
ncbi:PD-(D/E)XK nuclease family protein [Evansella sp. AB-P1]|uniref:PD-(D/E)XK nuclease family protein n=1 Tax=Evansella sp. AB-P1 TaxID=3037653 RepID=UPI00241F4862|nr:PD-(D/E)XK nuclease family protein [Evansella sp. AB-P1]MDG5787195.1 PD-(D/E)XK nuclease family protein [Evansella sp. AB-P1]